MIRAVLFYVLMIFSAEADSTTNYFPPIDPDTLVAEQRITIGPIEIGFGMLVNFISDDVVDDALNQYDETLKDGEDAVITAIEGLIPELEKLESNYRKIGIVTARIDKVREVDTSMVFAITKAYQDWTKMEETSSKIRDTENSISIFGLKTKLQKGK